MDSGRRFRDGEGRAKLWVERRVRDKQDVLVTPLTVTVLKGLVLGIQGSQPQNWRIIGKYDSRFRAEGLGFRVQVFRDCIGSKPQ